MNKPSEKLQAIFEAALALNTDTERADYLDRACSEPELRRDVESLLEAHRNPNSVFEEKTIRIQAPLSESPGTAIGRYTLLQLIGEGGFGAVYMAEQKEPVRRRVALKIIKLGMDTNQVVARFEAERQALAMMDHPNIAKVLDGGCTDRSVASDESQIVNRKSQISAGRPYFVMELVKGQPLTKYCDEHKLSTRQRLELFIPICQAIQHAHQKGIIHRDIKPSNILVATIDGRPVPKVIDFGIAKATQHDLTDKIVFTQFHQFMGTPAYMSPEQAAQDSTDIDTRSDIYSLGVLLYELLTGKTPVEAKELTRGGYDEIRRRIREIEPPTPSQKLVTLTHDELTTVAQSRAIEPARLPKLIRGELDWIVLKAMDKDRSRRYETASAFAQDIRRYLDGEPVTAVKPSPIYHFQKFARRHKAPLAAAACFALLLTVSACVSTAQAIKNKSLFTAAEEARLNEMNGKQREAELRRIAETERDRSQRLLYVANMTLAQQAWDDSRVGRVQELLGVLRPQAGGADLRGFEWFYLDRLCHSASLTLKHPKAIWGVAFSADGKRVASANNDRTVKVWDAATGLELHTLKGHTNVVSGVAFAPDGSRLASASYDRTVRVWDATSGLELLALRGHTGGVYGVAFSPDGKRLASASWDKTAKIWDAKTGQDILTLVGHTQQLWSVAFSPDGKQLASASSDQTVKVWDAMSGQEIRTLRGHNDLVSSVAFSPDGKRLASASTDKTVKVWDVTTGRETLTLRGHTAHVWGVAFSPDGKLVASASPDRTVRLWNATTGEETHTLKGHDGWVWSVAFGPDGKRLASAAGSDSQPGELKVWDIPDVQNPSTLNGHKDGVITLAFSPGGERLASASWDKTVKVWDAVTGQETLTLTGHNERVPSVAFSPDGKRLASGGNDPSVRIWDAATGQQLLTLKGHTNGVPCVVFSPDGKSLASSSFDRTIRLWDAATGEQKLTLNGHTDTPFRVSFAPDGKRLASASFDQTVKVWDTTSGREMLTLTGHTDRVACVVFSPDGKRLASASSDRSVKLWDSMTGEELLTLNGHIDVVYGVAFSPDGQRVASSSWDATIKIWEVVSGQEMFTLKGRGKSMGVVFSPDGKRLASGSMDQTVRLWDATPRSPASAPDAKTR